MVGRVDGLNSTAEEGLIYPSMYCLSDKFSFMSISLLKARRPDPKTYDDDFAIISYKCFSSKLLLKLPRLTVFSKPSSFEESMQWEKSSTH